MKANKEQSAIVRKAALELGAMIYDYFRKNEEARAYTMTVLGYAFESMLASVCDGNAHMYDMMSSNFRGFLAVAYEDVKKKANTEINQKTIGEA